MKRLTVLALLLAAAVATPALAQAPVLAYSTKGDFAYLDFNQPGGKTPAVKFACAKGSSEIDIADYEGANGAELKLTSGPETLALEAQKATGARGDFLKAHTIVANKVFIQLRENGLLDITGQGFSTKIAADAEGKRNVEQFFIACEPFEG
jgi:hypothetical protein